MTQPPRKPAVLKPLLSPLLAGIVSIALATFQIPEWLGGILLGVSGTWLAVSLASATGDVVRRWPWLKEWFPFLDPTGVALLESELKSNYICGKTFRLTDIAVGNVITGKVFERCVILGPAVIAPSGATFMREPIWKVRQRGGNLWPLDPAENPGNWLARDGAVVCEDCTFNECTFDGVGVAGPRSLFKDVVVKTSDGKVVNPSQLRGEDAETAAFIFGEQVPASGGKSGHVIMQHDSTTYVVLPSHTSLGGDILSLPDK